MSGTRVRGQSPRCYFLVVKPPSLQLYDGSVEICPFSLQRQFGNCLRWQFGKQHLAVPGLICVGRRFVQHLAPLAPVHRRARRGRPRDRQRVAQRIVSPVRAIAIRVRFTLFVAIIDRRASGCRRIIRIIGFVRRRLIRMQPRRVMLFPTLIS